MPRMRPAFLVALFGVVLAALPAAPPLRAQAPATLTVDLVVTDTDGRPVPSLRPDDLIIRLDGRPQTVTHIRALGTGAPPVRAGLPVPYGTNDGHIGRATAVLVDVARLHPTRGQAIHTGLTSFVASLPPGDRVALVPLSTDLRPVDFTTTHQRVLAAAADVILPERAPRTPRQDETAMTATLGAVARASVLLGSEPGVKTLVLITEPFAATSGLRRTIQSLADTLARHRVTLYIATPGSAPVPPGDGVHALASGTGGFVATGEWATMAQQEQARVEVTVTADTRLPRDAVVRALQTSVRPDVVVRGGPTVYIPEDTTPGLEALSDMVRQSRPYTDLPLRVAAYPIQHADGTSIRLLVVAETIEPDRKLEWSEFALVTADGRIVTQWTDDREALAQRPLISGVLASEGSYRLRWAASELSGRRGTVDVEVDAQFTPAGLFRLSALMLGRLVTDTFVPVLQPPVGTTEVEWYAEVYGETVSGQQLSARVDVLTAVGGPPVVTEAGRVLSSPDASRRAMTGRIDVGALAAGDYLLRATLVVNGQDAGSVTRTLRHQTPAAAGRE